MMIINQIQMIIVIVIVMKNFVNLKKIEVVKLNVINNLKKMRMIHYY